MDQTVKVGDFFVESWGYDQTNVDFYQVVKVSASGQTIWMRHVQSQRVKDSNGPADYVAPLPNAFDDIGQGSTRDGLLRKHLRVWQGGDGPIVSVHMTSYSNAYRWDGAPEYQTASGWGH